jgi:hypothetical protein
MENKMFINNNIHGANIHCIAFYWDSDICENWYPTKIIEALI